MDGSPGRDKGKRKLASELTEHMHRRFGLQFVFFRAGGHERPYGYAVIDHVNRMVHKGGDILRLGQILGESDGVRDDKRERKKYERPGGDDENKEFRASYEDGSLMSAFDAFIRQVEGDMKADVRSEDHVARKKRRKKGRE
jgi:hypothetical protein